MYPGDIRIHIRFLYNLSGVSCQRNYVLLGNPFSLILRTAADNPKTFETVPPNSEINPIMFFLCQLVAEVALDISLISKYVT